MNPTTRKFVNRRMWTLLAVFLGIFSGVGIFTMDHAEGLSYLSTDPAACANCHIMQPQYDSWMKSGHHHVATCVDCHLPHDFIGKYVAKLENGYHHSKGFTFQDFHEPIMIKEKNSNILQMNCVHCHDDTAHDMVMASDEPLEAVNCVHCHSRVGHGPRGGLGGPLRENEQAGETL